MSTSYLTKVNSALESITTAGQEVGKNIQFSQEFVKGIHDNQKVNVEVLMSQQNTVEQLQKDVQKNLVEYSRKVNEGLTGIFGQYDDNATKILGETHRMVEDVSETMGSVIESTKLLNDMMEVQYQRIEDFKKVVEEREVVGVGAAYEEN